MSFPCAGVRERERYREKERAEMIWSGSRAPLIVHPGLAFKLVKKNYHVFSSLLLNPSDQTVLPSAFIVMKKDVHTRCSKA